MTFPLTKISRVGRRLRESVERRRNRVRVDRAIPARPWYDRADAEARLAALGLDPDERERLAAFRAEGAMIIPGAVEGARMEALEQSIEKTWSGDVGGVFVEHYPNNVMVVEPIRAGLRDEPNKVLDLHLHSPAAAAVLTSPRLVRWLHLLLGPEVTAFQSLVFERGTQQGLHRDTNFVGLTPPWQMVAVWIALEDIEPGSGELEYYLGSHRLADYTFGDGSHFLADGSIPDDYSEHFEVAAEAAGLERARFRPRRGDALIWHAGLVHGGSAIERPAASRRSLVTHFSPTGAVPAYGWDRRNVVRRPCEPGLELSATVRRSTVRQSTVRHSTIRPAG